MRTADVLVVGAGMSGLTAARALEDDGVSVIVVDKGRSVGGRLATRRIDAGRVDHGAQFFTVRSDDFSATIERAVAEGVVYEWCQGFDVPADGHPRYAARPGMNALAKWLAAPLRAPVETGVRLEAVAATPDGVVATDDRGNRFRAPVAVMTAPVPQTLGLLERGGGAVAGDVEAALASVRYFATLALLAVLDRPPKVAGPGGEQHDDGPFTFVADNQRKGISAVPALTAHAAHDYSLDRYDDDPEQVHAELVDLAAPWIDDASIVVSQLKKWRYAGPVAPLPERCLVSEHTGARLVFAGDAFGGPKVEGAFSSGRAAAAACTTS